MKSSKKLLVALLVFTMLLSTVSIGFAAGFKDVADEEVAEAVERLVALKIINGYEDGTFRPANPITRAEFAKIVVTALGIGTAADYAKGASAFVDVPVNHWAVGYIKVANDMGIVLGRGNGVFSPEDQVTYAEAITMIVRALGYEPKAKAIGGFPGGYLAVAAEEDITDGINVVNSLAATRGDVAKMLDNALEVPMMYQATWGQYPEFKNDDEDKTLLKAKLGVKVIEGTVTDYDVTDKVVTIDGEKSEEYDVADNVSFVGMLNADVTAWKLGKKIVYFFEDSDVIYDAIKAFDDTKKTVEMYNSGKKYKAVDSDTFDEIKSELSEDEYAKFVLNKGKISSWTILLADAKATKAAVLTSKDDKAGKEYIKYQIGDGAERTFKFDFEDEEYTFVKNNKVATFKDLEEGDVVYVNTSDNVIVAFDVVVEGKLSRVGSDYITVAGTKYKFGTVYSSINDGEDYELGINEDLISEQVEAYKGADGKVAYIKGDVEESTSKLYGFVLSTTESLDVYKARVLLADGTVATYEFKDFAAYDDIPAAVRAGNGDLLKYFKFSINKDGKISAISEVYAVEVDRKDLDDAGKSFLKADGNTLYVANDVKVFNMEDAISGDNISKAGDVKLVDWSRIADAKNVSGINIIGYTDGDELVAIVITSGYETAAGDSEYAYVKDAYKISKDEWEAVLVNAAEEITLVFDIDMTDYIDQVIEYRVNSDDEGVFEDSVANYVAPFNLITAVDTSKSLVTVSGTVYKVSADAIVFNVDVPEEISLSEIKAELEAMEVADELDRKIKAAVYVDDKGLIKAILVKY